MPCSGSAGLRCWQVRFSVEILNQRVEYDRAGNTQHRIAFRAGFDIARGESITVLGGTDLEVPFDVAQEDVVEVEFILTPAGPASPSWAITPHVTPHTAVRPASSPRRWEFGTIVENTKGTHTVLVVRDDGDTFVAMQLAG